MVQVIYEDSTWREQIFILQYNKLIQTLYKEKGKEEGKTTFRGEGVPI